MAKEADKPAPKPQPLTVNYVAECEKDLAHHLNRGVKIIPGKRKGKLVLEYYNDSDLQLLLDLLQK